MTGAHAWLALCLTVGMVGCLKKDPLYCDETTPCMDPERPFCDLNGEFPASEGIRRTCIASPFDAGPDVDAGPTRSVVDLVLGPERTCALIDDGAVRCWGKEHLGYPAGVAPVGDDEHPYETGDVPTGGIIREVALMNAGSCFLYEAGNVRCVGRNSSGLLGYGHTDPVPDTPADADDLDLGEPAQHISGGADHVCAILVSGAVRCWGYAAYGGLGYQTFDTTFGDDETPAELDALEIGGAVTSLAHGLWFSCAILGGGDGRVRCWGFNMAGWLGYGHTQIIGDNEAPGSEGDVMEGVSELTVDGFSVCALRDGGTVKCWGDGDYFLGYGTLATRGDDEEARSVTDVNVGGIVEHLGGGRKCALMSDHSVRCWGRNEFGELGTGDREPIGDNEDPVDAKPTLLDGAVSRLARGSSNHMCALMETGSVRCWGKNEDGELGLAHQESIGDNESPANAPPVRVLE
jgi:alpha-tubulin suppressor-like RCC1 family protein